MINPRREWLIVTLFMWILAASGLSVARGMWQDYGFSWIKFFEMPLGPALLIGFAVVASLVFIGVGFGGLMWATEEQE